MAVDDDEIDEVEDLEDEVDGEPLDEPAAGEERPKKFTKEQALQVERTAMQLMAAGFATKRLDQKLALDFAMSERNARRYRVRVEKQLKVSGSSPLAEMIGVAYQQALKGGKISAAIGAVNALAKMKPADPLTLRLYRDLGDPPKEPLQALEYTMKSLVIQQREIMLDSSLEPSRRRAELRANARAVLACVPRVTLKKAHDAVKSFAEGKQDPTTTRETTDVANEPGGSLRADAGRGPRFKRRPPG